MAVNRIDTVNFSRITASYGYTGAWSAISSFWVQYRTKLMKNEYFFYYKLMNLVAKLRLPIFAPKLDKLHMNTTFSRK